MKAAASDLQNKTPRERRSITVFITPAADAKAAATESLTPAQARGIIRRWGRFRAARTEGKAWQGEARVPMARFRRSVSAERFQSLLSMKVKKMTLANHAGFVNAAAAAAAKGFEDRVDSVELLADALARHFTDETGEGDDEEAADAALASIIEEMTDEAYAALRERFEESLQERRTDFLKRDFVRLLS